MRHLPVVLMVVGLAALAAIPLNFSKRYELANCAAGGSAGTTVTSGHYVLRITDADTRLCVAESANPDAGTVCGASDGGAPGEMFPAGTVMEWTVLGQPDRDTRTVSCSSAAGTGDVHLTRTQ